MKRNEKNTARVLLWLGWAFLFLVCAVLGCIPEQDEVGKILLIVFGSIFFVPPAILLVLAWKNKDTKDLKRLRMISMISLSASFILMVANFLSVLAPQWVGDVLYWTLAVVGTPMACLQNAYVSLLLWAVLLFAAMEGLKEAKK